MAIKSLEKTNFDTLFRAFGWAFADNNDPENIVWRQRPVGIGSSKAGRQLPPPFPPANKKALHVGEPLS